MRSLALFTALTLFALPAAAQQTAEAPPAAPAPTYRAVTEIDGDELRLQGETKGPTGAVVNLRRAGTFRPLLQLRENFDVEMQASANAVR